MLMSRMKLTGAHTWRSVKCTYHLYFDGCQRSRPPTRLFGGHQQPIRSQTFGVTKLPGSTMRKQLSSQHIVLTFCTYGISSQGYMGIQDRSPKWPVIFSLWDKAFTDVNPNAPSEDLVKLLAQGENVTVQRFAGEGTGGQIHLVYDWKVGQTYQLQVNVRPDAEESEKVIFTGWFRIPELNIWRLLASFKVRPWAANYGLYSFLEDWTHTGRRRQGLYGQAWIKTDYSSWVQAKHGIGIGQGL